MTKHSEICLAPLCQDDYTDTYIWYPGEPVCTKKPYTKWQKQQHKINKHIGKQTKPHYLNEALTVPDLEHRFF